MRSLHLIRQATYLAAACALHLYLAANLSAAEGRAERPNIIVIMTDDQGWGDTGYNGNAEVKTPNIDRLAASGIRFNNG